MKLIKLTEKESNRTFYINSNIILEIKTNSNGGSLVIVERIRRTKLFGKEEVTNGCFIVIETPEQIVKQIN